MDFFVVHSRCAEILNIVSAQIVSSCHSSVRLHYAYVPNLKKTFFEFYRYLSAK